MTTNLTPEQKRAILEKRRQENNMTESTQNSNQNRGCRAIPVNAIVIFLGSLLGTLIGTFASFNDLVDSLERIGQFLNPPTTICIAGSSTILGEGLGVALAWKQEFEAETGIQVTIKSTGSLGGVQAAANKDCVNVLAMSEVLTPELESQLISSGVEIQCATEIGYDIIAFVTDTSNRLIALEDNFMGDILTGEATNWSQVQGYNQPIYIYARRNSGTTDYVLREFGWTAGEAQLPPNANYFECASNEDCLNKTLATPGSIYWVSTSWMFTQPTEYLRVLPILQGDEYPTNPLLADVDISTYPNELVRPLYMYVLSSDSTDPKVIEASRAFLDYIRGVKGQQILEQHHFYTYFNRPAEVPLTLPRGFSEDLTKPRNICKLSS